VPAPTRTTPHSPLPVVIDTDPGIDDLLALLLALASPELDVRGITVSYGNTLVEHAHRNAVAILRFAGRRVPLGVGARRPLRRPLAVARETHGDGGLGYAAVPPAGSVLDYVLPLNRLLAEQAEPVVLITLGPLTSLALALRGDPALVRAKVRRHIAVAGNLDAPGNTTKFSEFNAWCDPEALAHVLEAKLPTELVGLDVTRRLTLSGSDVARLGAADDPRARWLHDALRFYVDFHRAYEGLDGCVVNDVLPVAAVIDPAVLTLRPLRIAVELADGEHRGRTQVSAGGAHAFVAVEVNPKPVQALLVERVLPWMRSLSGAAA
jgi:inosine-uridine nucleoside N-ribohydrolase